MRLHEINLIEIRSHPEQNPKLLTIDILQKYLNQYGDNKLYVHFGNIEKVGINLQSKNMFGPHGVYAFPLKNAIPVLDSIKTKTENAKYANILEPTSSAHILNLDTVDVNTMQKILQNAIAFHRKNTKDKPNRYSHFNSVTTVKQIYRSIESLLENYVNRRPSKKLSYLENVFFRSQGYDAIFDTQRIINDNPNQIVFLTPKAFKVIETIPLRFKR